MRALTALLLCGAIITMVSSGVPRALGQGPTGRDAPPANKKPAKKTAPTKKTAPAFRPTNPRIELVRIPPGSFMMGSTNGDPDEKPVHQVTINYSFYMGKYEVTQAQWQSVMGSNPSIFKGCDNCPVEQVSRDDAQDFIRSMGRLDADRPYVGTIKIVIEHSLADDNDPHRFQVKRFASLALAEKWFNSREVDGMPGRNTRPVIKCAKGVCSYNSEGGILHNNLYLTKITYGIRGGCPYIKTIYLLDGD